MKSIPSRTYSAFASLHEENNPFLQSFIKVTSGKFTLYLKGRLFNSTPERLLADFSTIGMSAFTRLDGDFLLLVAEANKLTFIRDRHGVGAQLFYTSNWVAHSLLAFTGIDDFVCEPDVDALMTFLSIGYIPAPQTSLKTVSKLKAGHAIVVSGCTFTVIDLFDQQSYFEAAGKNEISEPDAIRKYEDLHKSAIAKRIEGKSKVGLLLSGGYDSGGNISALRDVYQGDVVSYSIGFKNNSWSELPLARILADRYNSRHYEYEIDGSEIMHLPHILQATGDPFQEGGLLVNYSVMKLVEQTGENPGIILGGDGNDQHFGTSGKELAMHWKIKRMGLQPLQKAMDGLGNISSLFEKDNILFRMQFHNRKILHIQESDTFGFTLAALKRISKTKPTIRRFDYLLQDPVSYKSFEEFYYSRNYNIDIRQVIDEVILYKSSRMSELFNTTMSFPYMSTDLYNFLCGLPVNYKFKGSIDDLAAGRGVSKSLHKSYLHPKLPTEITERKKQGGFAPLAIFLSDDKQRKLVCDYIKSSDMAKALFNPHDIEQLVQDYDRSMSTKPYWFWYHQVKSNQLINLLTLAVWWDMVINKKHHVTSIEELL